MHLDGRFANHAVREALLAHTPAAEHARIAALAVDALETPPPRMAGWVAGLCDLARKASTSRQEEFARHAIDLRRAAAETARSEFRQVECATEMLAIAGSALLSVGDQTEALHDAATAFQRAGMPHQAIRISGEGIRSCELNGLKDRAVEFRVVLGISLQAVNRHEEALAIFLEMLDNAIAANDRSRQMLALSNIGDAHRKRGDLQASLDALRRTVELAKSLGSLENLPKVLHTTAIVQGQLGNTAEQEAILKEVLELDALSGDVVGRARSQGSLAVLYMRQDRLADARGPLEEAVATFARLNHRYDELFGLINLGTLENNCGNYLQSARLMKRAYALARSLGAVEDTATLESILAFGALGQGDAEGAERHARGCIKIADVWDLHNDQAAGGVLLTQALLLQRRHDEALQAADAGLEAAHKTAHPRYVGNANRAKASALLALRRHDEARERAMEALENLEDAGLGRTQEYLAAVAVAARIELADGRRDDARFPATDAVNLRQELVHAGRAAAPDPDWIVLEELVAETS